MFAGYVKNVEDVDDISNTIRSRQQEIVTQAINNQPSKSRQREDGSNGSLSKDDSDRGSSDKQRNEIDNRKSGYISEERFNTFIQSYDSNMTFIRQSLQSLNGSYSEESRYDFGCDPQYDYEDGQEQHPRSSGGTLNFISNENRKPPLPVPYTRL